MELDAYIMTMRSVHLRNEPKSKITYTTSPSSTQPSMVQGLHISFLVLPAFDIHSPEHCRNVDERQVVSNMASNANTLPESEREVSLFLGVSRAVRDLPLLMEVASRIEMHRVRTVSSRVTIEVRDVGNDDGA